MGFFDKVKNKINNATAALTQQGQPQAPQQAYQAPVGDDDDDRDDDDRDDEGGGHYESTPGDTAGFDWDGDEDAYWEAMVAIESEGMTMTALTRDQAFQRYGIRDHMHWQDVKDNVWNCLAHKYGSHEIVMQRQMNHRQGMMQRHQQQQVASMQAGGGFTPVEGISLEKWAAINAAIAAGHNFEDLLKGNGISATRWHAARTEWEARMSRDTTFAIATVYGQAFQAASTGRFAPNVRDANAARAENRDMQMPPPVSVEQFFEILFEQSFAPDAAAALRGMGLSVTDWVDLGTVMGYFIHRTWAHNHAQYNAASERARAQAQARYPGVDRDVDLQF
ncbi:MAG: hypothetical protein ACTHU0_32210 [Kofleriaceae bacterium]